MKIQEVISNVGITEKNGKQHVHIRSMSLPFCSSEQSSVPNFEEKGSEKKNECLVGLKESLPQIFSWACSIFCQKGLCKIRYGFEGLIFKYQFWPVLAEPIHV